MKIKNILKYWIDILLNVINTISLSILGYYTFGHNIKAVFMYNIVLIAFFISGVWIYKSDGIKELGKELIKSSIIAIMFPIAMMYVNGQFDSVFFKSSLTSIFYAFLLKLFIKEIDAKLKGISKKNTYVAYVIASITFIYIYNITHEVIMAMGYGAAIVSIVKIIKISPEHNKN
ncbi:hypothetical protein R2R35_14655 [Anaerocolumna sp. AGMB13020]|uniref:hypothetical protein n=1 Tax=Anaerocolumna sp. AGMB13020 TaxID=3081750 RepID=UPI0029559545|nr:hypothetical protein [Anaerocolumna sp. AGMB13020]WOO35038.1 hypothetical protein R2R35_14655 [Anaerocolumna sp. AGMB13020]